MTDFYQQIEAYNLGKLSPEEAAQMEAAMTADNQLATAVLQQRAAWETQELLAEKLLRAQIRQQFDAQRPAPANWFSRSWKWLLPLALLLPLGMWLFLQNDRPAVPEQPAVQPAQESPALPQPPTPKGETPAPSQQNVPIAETPPPVAPDWGALAAASYAMPESLGNLRGQAGDTLALATAAFSQKKYRQVVQLLTPLPEESQQEALLLRAHAQFLAKNFDAAASDFAQLEIGGIYKKEAEWYGLLARMAGGKFDPKGDGKILDGIRNNEKHPHTADAAVLYKKLRNGE